MGGSGSVSQEVGIRLAGGSMIHWRLNWGFCGVASCPFLTSCWLKYKFLRTHGAAWVSSWRTAGFQSEWWRGGWQQDRKYNAFYNFILELTFHHFCCILLSYGSRNQPRLMRNVAAQRCEYQVAGVIGGILENGYSRVSGGPTSREMVGNQEDKMSSWEDVKKKKNSRKGMRSHCSTVG